MNLFLCIKDRLYIRYVLSRYAAEAEKMNELIQRSVEHGIYQFYMRMEAFLLELKKPFYGTEPYGVTIITMDHMWMYLCGYMVANCFCVIVFICELLYFHQKKIANFFRRVFGVPQRMLQRINPRRIWSPEVRKVKRAATEDNQFYLIVTPIRHICSGFFVDRLNSVNTPG